MADVGFFFVGFILGTYGGLVLKKNNQRLLPQQVNFGVLSAQSDKQREVQMTLNRYNQSQRMIKNSNRFKEKYNI